MAHSEADRRGIEAIDAVFDFGDKVLDGLSHFIGRHKKFEAKARGAAGTAEPAARSSTEITVRKPFRIDEVIDAETSVTSYVVTNGDKRAECQTLEFAQELLRRLEP